jgi:CoA:oxalate CoA-transferase
VLKIERPGAADGMRAIGPYIEGAKGRRTAGEMRIMTNKRSIALDLASPAGIDIFFRLVPSYDIVYSNQKPDSLQRLGITYDALRERNPSVIYSTLSGFGHDDVLSSGPYGKFPAFDLIAQGMAGLLFRPDSADGGPAYNGIPIGDEVTSLISIIGTLAAVHSRAKTGLSQRVDVAMHDAMVFVNELAIGNYALLGTIAGRGRSQTSAPYGSYKCADGWVNIGVGFDSMWVRFCAAIGRPELANDSRYLKTSDRVVQQDELNEIVSNWTREQTVEEVVGQMFDSGVVCAPIYEIPDVMNSDQVRARNMLIEVDDPIVGRQKIVGNPIKIRGASDNVVSPPPVFGQNTVDVLREELGMEDKEIDSLRRDGVIDTAF